MVSSFTSLSYPIANLTLPLARKQYGIFSNAIAPVAASQMTKTVMPQEFLDKLAPEAIVPLVAYLSHESTTENGKVFEAGAGWYGEIRWERTKGVVFKTDQSFTPAAVRHEF